MSWFVIAARDMQHLIQIAEDASKNGKLLVLEFMGSVTYSSPCKFMKPIFESIAADCKNKNVKADFCTVDVDNKNFKEFAEDWGVQVLPTFWMVLDYYGREDIVAPDKEELIKIINKWAPKK